MAEDKSPTTTTPSGEEEPKIKEPRAKEPKPKAWTEHDWRGRKMLSCAAGSCRFNTFDRKEMDAHQRALHEGGEA